MLPLSSKLDKQTINSILKAGHSRIPIYKNDRQNVIGVVLVKQLLLQDPENNVPLGNIKIRGLPRIKPQTPLFEILHVFQEGSSHMALVVEEVQEHEIGNLPSNGMFGKSPLFPFSGSDAIPYRILGIVTLEDIIEEILGSEIVDETDVYSDVVSRTRVTSSRRFMSPKISVNRAMDETEALIAEQRIADETTALLNKGRVTLTSVVVEDVKNEKRRFKESGLVEAAKLAKAIADNQFQSSDKLIDLEEEEFKLDK